jgi:transposase
MHLLDLHNLGTYTHAELAELFGVGRSTIDRTLHRMRPASPEPEALPRSYRPGSRHTQGGRRTSRDVFSIS